MLRRSFMGYLMGTCATFTTVGLEKLWAFNKDEALNEENVLGLFNFVKINDNNIEERCAYICHNNKETHNRMVKFTKKPILSSSGDSVYIAINKYKTLAELKESALDLVNFCIKMDDKSLEYVKKHAVLLYTVMPTENKSGMVGLTIL